MKLNKNPKDGLERQEPAPTKDGDAEKQGIEDRKRNSGLKERADGTETGLIILKMNPKSWRAAKAE